MTQTSAPDRSIGDIIAQSNNLSVEQVEAILSKQRESGLKFGEAAVALGLIKREDVLWALSQQFQYPYHADTEAAVSSELIVATNPFENHSEFFRDVRSQLMTAVFHEGAPPAALAVCSTASGDGKTFFASNLAVAFSQLGARTLIVDADMRTPRLHEVFGLDAATTGLSTILTGRSEPNVIRPIPALPSLFLLPVGVIPPNPLELVQRVAFDHLLHELLQKFDFVLVDTPAATHGADARVIAAKCGASVVIGRKNVTQIDPIKKLIQSLNHTGHRFGGVVMNER